MPRVVHFEITANDPDKVIPFYTDVFGWKVTKFPGPQEYWLIETGSSDEPGINGGFFKPPEKYSATVNTVDVPSVDEYSAKVIEAGGEVVVEKMAIPGVGYLVYCKDVEGTIFGLMESNPEAK